MADVIILEARAIAEELKRVVPHVLSIVRPSMLVGPGELCPEVLKALRDLIAFALNSQRNGTWSEPRAIAYKLCTGTPVPPGLPNHPQDAAVVLDVLRSCGVAT
jgi:hypothetical protein